MTDFSTSDHLRTLLKALECEMKHAQALESSAALELTAARYRGVQGGLAFAAGSITYMLESLREASE